MREDAGALRVLSGCGEPERAEHAGRGAAGAVVGVERHAVPVEGRVGIGAEDPGALPLGEQAGGDLVAVAVAVVAGEDQPDGVVGVGCLEGGALVVVDDVVRGCGDRVEVGSGEVPQAAKGKELGHRGVRFRRGRSIVAYGSANAAKPHRPPSATLRTVPCDVRELRGDDEAPMHADHDHQQDHRPDPGDVVDAVAFADDAARAYEAYQEGSRLLEDCHPHAAAVVLERARDLEPDKASIRETLARAYFRSGRIPAARSEFARAVEIEPVNDYAHFGLGLCLLRTGDRVGARRHLKLAVAMRPREEYRDALAQAAEPVT